MGTRTCSIVVVISIRYKLKKETWCEEDLGKDFVDGDEDLLDGSDA